MNFKIQPRAICEQQDEFLPVANKAEEVRDQYWGQVISFTLSWSIGTALFLKITFRAIFNLVLKVIRDCIGFALLCSVSGLENSRHLLSQSDTKLKPIATWLLAFSRA